MLKQKHPDWGVRRIGDELGVSKDKVYRILRRIEKGDIEVARDGKVIDRSKPKGAVALQKEASERVLSQLGKRRENVKGLRGTVEQHGIKQTPIGSPEVHEEVDPLEELLLKTSWRIKCDRCGTVFEHKFTDDQSHSLIEEGYTYVSCPKCRDYPSLDFLGAFPQDHKIFIRLSDVFRSYLVGSKVLQTKKSS